MATVKIKFRVSSIETKAGTLYYQVIHNQSLYYISAVKS